MKQSNICARSCLTRYYDEFGTLMSQAGCSFGLIYVQSISSVRLYVGGGFLFVCLFF